MLKTMTDTAQQLGESAGQRLDELREETGDALHTAASSVRNTGRQGTKAIDDLAGGTADRLDATANYIEDHDVRAVWTDLQRFGRRHPAGTFLLAASLGFLVGSAFSRAARTRG